jgi:transcriptional regulator with XRE-family HTH domain
MPVKKISIKDLRTSKRLTQVEFAKSIGVFWTAVSKWERNERVPRDSMIRKIEELYKVKLDY